MCCTLPCLMIEQYVLKRVGVSGSYYIVVTLIQLLTLDLKYSNLAKKTTTRFFIVDFFHPTASF
jgi:hypothetical protein